MALSASRQRRWAGREKIVLTHANGRRGGQDPGVPLQGTKDYVSLLSGMIQIGLVQQGKEEATVNNYMCANYRELWANQGHANECHTEGCEHPLRDGNNRGATEIMGGLHNILFAVEQLHDEGAGVDLKRLVDDVCTVGPDRLTRLLCTYCNPVGGQSGRTFTDPASVAARPALMDRFRLQQD
jgi:hypothetical protein